MNKLYLLAFIFILASCSEDPDPGEPVVPDPVSPVVLNLDEVPYQTLSTYNFFKTPIKDQKPEYGVIPYEPINTLFTDYAHKNRFIWLPDGTTVEYTNDYETFEFPEGSAVIKNFYYDNVLPNDETRILETRIMIMKNGQWIFADYVWNDEQTEAFLDLNGSFVNISWLQDGETKTANYRIPSEAECFTCHKIGEEPHLIGPKPAGLNSIYNYADGAMNQIEKWREFGYYNGSTTASSMDALPSWKDTSLDKETRMRAYIDINCAHCHKEDAHCSYTDIRLDWNSTASAELLGKCETLSEPLDGFIYVIQPGNADRSGMFGRFNSEDQADMMPIIGRSIIDEEAVELMRSWINELPSENCD